MRGMYRSTTAYAKTQPRANVAHRVQKCRCPSRARVICSVCGSIRCKHWLLDAIEFWCDSAIATLMAW